MEITIPTIMLIACIDYWLIKKSIKYTKQYLYEKRKYAEPVRQKESQIIDNANQEKEKIDEEYRAQKEAILKKIKHQRDTWKIFKNMEIQSAQEFQGICFKNSISKPNPSELPLGTKVENIMAKLFIYDFNLSSDHQEKLEQIFRQWIWPRKYGAKVTKKCLINSYGQIASAVKNHQILDKPPIEIYKFISSTFLRFSEDRKWESSKPLRINSVTYCRVPGKDKSFEFTPYHKRLIRQYCSQFIPKQFLKGHLTDTHETKLRYS